MTNFTATTRALCLVAVSVAFGLTLLGCAHQPVRLNDSRDVDSLAHALRRGNPSVRKEAVKRLGATRDNRAIPPLINALRDKDYDVRWAASTALPNFGEAAVIPLIEAIKDPRFGPTIMRSLSKLKPWEIPILWGFIGEEPAMDPRYLANHALVKIGKPSVPALVEALKDPKWYVRVNVSSALAQIKDPRAVDALLIAIKDNRREVSHHVASALRGMVDDRAVDPLIEALNDPRQHVRFFAVSPLALTKDPRVVEPLIAAATNDKDSHVRRAAIGALSGFPNPRVVETLTKMPAFKNANEPEHEAIITALGVMGKIGLPPLIELLDHPSAPTREVILGFMGRNWQKSGENAALRAILGSLKDSNSRVRRAAIHALSPSRGARYEGERIVVEPLIEMLKDKDWEVRVATIGALGVIGDPRAIESLIEALGDPDKNIRASAPFALREIRDAAKDRLIASLASKDENLRKNVAGALWFFRDAQAVWALAQTAVRDDSAPVRQAAVVGMKNMGEFAINILTQKQNDPDADVREIAAQALAKIKLQK